MGELPAKMKTAVMLGIGKIGWEERPVPEPGPGEVLVKVERVGVCGSDLHYFTEGRIGPYVVQPPFVLGHEAGGKVAKLGPGVRNLRVGDTVALEPGKTCGHCHFCTTGRYHLCPDVVFFATPPVDGVFCEYVAHPESLSFKVPDGMDSLDAALIEPLAVGFHAAGQGGAVLGQKAVVFGTGCIGLMSLLALKARGLTGIAVADVMPRRLEKARSLGAAHAVNSREEDFAEASRRITGGDGWDLAIETSGAEAAVRQAIETVRKGATVVLVGYGPTGEMTLPLSLALDKEITFRTVFRYHHIYPMAIEAVAAGSIRPRDVATNIFEFDDLQACLDQSVSNKAEIVKSVVKIA
ncbi:MAG: NAD(P)-dependent alcohol dehydrogenase [Deltaproteobacteria bacterium]|jgi:L-iditol 2-dehydrogenase|nr:NAD(P)-dependent alcohol dehydrogenase [Deltaproteobacteria bacterium]